MNLEQTEKEIKALRANIAKLDPAIDGPAFTRIQKRLAELAAATCEYVSEEAKREMWAKI